ncbi:hypothetical protein B0T26DRAFT_722418 [Lasiosphaeria miniovina]|uniref:Uncharacterized protein n=1 Tax=Lasiosphaeria miniovina TaxID=1954250 RepID=A0AA40DNG4_9PEZI|nr:uncharacterized protein B0T26DRAFT_722418 [Lasiosphaeria miniovina]KAK0709655.1 hypothetical protein B0T26DRAFT_722418 [Lasiosphaeria miniovina]
MTFERLDPALHANKHRGHGSTLMARPLTSAAPGWGLLPFPRPQVLIPPTQCCQTAGPHCISVEPSLPVVPFSRPKPFAQCALHLRYIDSGP